MTDKTLVSQKPISVLLAEDDEDDILLFKEVLSENNVETNLLIAKNGIEAVDILIKEPSVDIVFLDINMPLKNGLECLEHIRHLPGVSAQVPVIMLSTAQNERLIESARKLGASAYIKKAISFVKYKSTITDVLSRDWRIGLKPDFFVA